MIDIDYSFLRLRDNLEDAKNLSESPTITHEFVGQVALVPNETYFQITNSPTAVNLSSWEAHLVDACGNVLTEITSNIFLQPFTDTNGIVQVAWEFINTFEYSTKPVSIRFTETSNGNTWFTNLFTTTVYNSETTVRFDYKNVGYHYGTQYNRVDYYQSIRLQAYFDNAQEDISVGEYTQISTNLSVPDRATYVFKEQYILEDSDEFTKNRLNRMLRSSEIYITRNNSSYRVYNTEPIDSEKREADSNIVEREMVLNPDYSQLFTFEYQIFDGIELITKIPEGVYTLTSLPTELKGTFNYPITINTGSLTIYDASDDSVLVSFTEVDMSLDGLYSFVIDITGDVTVNGNYYVQFDSGLISVIGIDFNGIDNKSDWAFSVTDGDYDNADYDNTDYLTN